MEKLPPLGKIHPAFFKKYIYPRLGASDRSVLVKPRSGVDFGVIDLGHGQVMALSTDPFYIARELGIEKAAWFAVHILASDVAVSGIRPRFMSVDLNLPPEMTQGELVRMWSTVHEECAKLGINVVTGHTARYAGCHYPMVGGATVFGIGSRKDLIIPKARVGDKVIVSKGPAIETTGLMSAYFPSYLEQAHGAAFVRRAQRVYYQMSTVEDARIAGAIGGVTAMHDATEGGVYGGLAEIAGHSGVGMHIHEDRIVLPETVAKSCAVFGIDPYISISEGTLLATARPDRANRIVAALEAEGIAASVVGEVVPRSKGLFIFSDGRRRPLKHPKTDPFWIKFEEYGRRSSAAQKGGRHGS
jgi:hydrogenase expression/formation protein HypE